MTVTWSVRLTDDHMTLRWSTADHMTVTWSVGLTGGRWETRGPSRGIYLSVSFYFPPSTPSSGWTHEPWTSTLQTATTTTTEKNLKNFKELILWSEKSLRFSVHLWNVFFGYLEVDGLLDPGECTEREGRCLLSLAELCGSVVERDLHHHWCLSG